MVGQLYKQENEFGGQKSLHITARAAPMGLWQVGLTEVIEPHGSVRRSGPRTVILLYRTGDGRPLPPRFVSADGNLLSICK